MNTPKAQAQYTISLSNVQPINVKYFSKLVMKNEVTNNAGNHSIISFHLIVIILYFLIIMIAFIITKYKGCSKARKTQAT